MEAIMLNKEETKLAQELANLYYWMDESPASVSNDDIGRLYAAAANNPKIHYRALELNKAMYKKRKEKNGVR